MVNIVGDLVLVAGFHLDAVGAAIATVAAQAVSVVCAVVMLLKKALPFSIKKADFRLNFQCKKFLAIGLPLALQEFLTQLSFLALCAFVNRLGLEASSGYGVACKIVNFAMLIPSALMQSMVPSSPRTSAQASISAPGRPCAPASASVCSLACSSLRWSCARATCSAASSPRMHL